jgi:hypothetical protein
MVVKTQVAFLPLQYFQHFVKNLWKNYYYHKIMGMGPTEGGWFRRVMLNTGSGVTFGAIAGAAASAWKQAPGTRVVGGGRAGQASFALQNLTQGALLFGTVGASFAIGESTAEAFTGSHGAVAAGMGGAFAGAVLGMPSKSPRGVVGGAALLGALSFVMTAL